MPFLLYLMLSVMMSFISVWYAVTAPAMYCTAIMSAVCMELISINLIVRVVEDARQGRTDWIILVKLIGGSFSSALAFGCRPTIALAGLIQIPMVCRYRKIAKSRKMRVKSFLAIGIPYFLIAALLMWYNYARFGNVFEFGQSYQLTVADQHSYSFFKEFRLGKILNGLVYQFASWIPIGETFPYVSYMGIACFIAIGFRCETRKQSFFITALVFVSLINFFLLIIVPYDGNTTAYDPQLLIKIEKFVFWWK